MNSRIHVVDDDAAVRLAMVRLVRAAGHDVLAHACANELLSALADGRPGCIVLDVQMPGLSGLEVQDKILNGENPLPIIFLTGHAQIPDSVRAIQRGAVDFLTKPVQGPVLLAAIERALAKDAADRETRRRLRELRDRYDRLTPREREVLVHLISGQLNKQAAADLNIAERTIKLHRARIFEKLEADSMASLARIAIELGISPAEHAK